VYGWIVGLLLLSASLACRLACRVAGLRAVPCFAAVVLLATAGVDFGQREHGTLLAVLPYLVLAGARIDRRTVPLSLAATVALAAVAWRRSPSSAGAAGAGAEWREAARSSKASLPSIS
jgi:hypothetical protein